MGFFGSAASFFPVTLDTAGNDVGPFGLSPPGFWDDVIIVKFFGGKFPPAVLAPVFVSRIDVLP